MIGRDVILDQPGRVMTVVLGEDAWMIHSPECFIIGMPFRIPLSMLEFDIANDKD